MKDPEKIAKRAEMKRRECRLCLYYNPEARDCSVGMENCVLDEFADSGPKKDP